jgi:hypothetical protein
MPGKGSYILLGIAAIVGGLLLAVKSYSNVSLAELLEWVPIIGMAILGGLFTSLSAFEAIFSFFDAPGRAQPNSPSCEQ